MTLPGFVILVLLVFVLAAIYLELGALPGKKARERGHPQADAINVLGWFGLLLGFVPWVGAFVWAYTRPGLGTAVVEGAAPAPSAGAGQRSDETEA